MIYDYHDEEGNQVTLSVSVADRDNQPGLTRVAIHAQYGITGFDTHIKDTAGGVERTTRDHWAKMEETHGTDYVKKEFKKMGVDRKQLLKNLDEGLPEGPPLGENK